MHGSGQGVGGVEGGIFEECAVAKAITLFLLPTGVLVSLPQSVRNWDENMPKWTQQAPGLSSAVDSFVMLAFPHDWLQNHSKVIVGVIVKINSCRPSFDFSA